MSMMLEKYILLGCILHQQMKSIFHYMFHDTIVRLELEVEAVNTVHVISIFFELVTHRHSIMDKNAIRTLFLENDESDQSIMLIAIGY